jgi:hypothetical protein
MVLFHPTAIIDKRPTPEVFVRKYRQITDNITGRLTVNTGAAAWKQKQCTGCGKKKREFCQFLRSFFEKNFFFEFLQK